MSVNDNAAHLSLISQILSRSGMTVVEATDGQEALTRLAPDFDVVVLDVNLPDIDGFEVCRKIKAEFDPFLPVLLISAESVATIDRVVGLEGGADGYLNLPVEPRELVATVNSLGRLRRAERDRELQTEVAVLTAETAVDMAGDLQLSEVLRKYATSIVNELDLDAAAIWIHDEGMFRLAATAGVAAADEGSLQDEFRLPVNLRNGLKSSAESRLRLNDFDVRQLAQETWLERHQLSSAAGYLLPGNDAVTGLAALFSSRPISGELVDLLAASSDSVALGVERKRGQQALAQSEEASERSAQRIRQLEVELAQLERISRVGAPVASRAFGAQPIGKTHPAEFSKAVEDFSHLLRFAMQERSNRVEHQIPVGLRDLADRLVQLSVGPRDVIEIYSAALKAATESTTGRKDHAYVEEGRLLVLELMGNLVSNYRALSLAFPPGQDRNHQPDRGEPEPRGEVKRNG